MSKLDEAWEKFDKARKELREARDRVNFQEILIMQTDARLGTAREQAKQIVADAESAVAAALGLHKHAVEEVERAQRRLRYASKPIAQLLNAEVAGSCGADPRSDVEKVLGDGEEPDETPVGVETTVENQP